MKKKSLLLVTALLLGSLVKSNCFDATNKIDVTYADSITLDQQQTISTSYSSLYDSVCEGIVCCMKYKLVDSAVTRYSHGSGFVYDEDKNYYYIITNQHVIDGNKKMTAFLYNSQEVPMYVIGSDKYQDVAVCKIKKQDCSVTLKVLELNKDIDGNCCNPEVGETVAAIGAPVSYSYRGSITFGSVSGVDRVATQDSNNIFEQSHAIQTDTGVNGGNSGGPLINLDGKVLGIVSFKLLNDGETLVGLNFAYPVHDLIVIINKIRASETITAVTYSKRVSLSTNKRYKSMIDLSIYERAKLGLMDHYEGAVLMNYDEVLGSNDN